MSKDDPVRRKCSASPLKKAFCWLLVFLTTVHTLCAASGVLFYNQITSRTGPIALRQVNGDGTGDQGVLAGLPGMAHPTISRDGRRLLVTSPDPGRPFKLSQNVYSQDLATLAIRRITSFEDVLTSQGVTLTNDLGEIIGNRINSGYTINTPYYKAFSPEGSRVVVMNLRKTGTVSRDNINSITNQHLANPEGATSGRFPVVEIYSASDGQALGSYVFLGIERTGFNQGGDGVDWHPTREEIVAAVSSDIPATGNSGRTGMEGTVLAVFSGTGPSAFLRKLTAPSGRADVFFDISTLISTAYAEHDYAPAISPDGQRVAYVRHTLRQDNRYDGAGIAPLPAVCTLRVINYDGTGDRELLRLSEGLWVTTVTWSPNGAEVAFDLAPQTVANGWNSLSGDPLRSEIYAVGIEGGTPRRLASAPAAYPAWAPGVQVQPVVPPVLRFQRGSGTGLDLQVDQLAPGRVFVVEGSVNLANWESLGTFTAEGTSHRILITPDPRSPFAIYRVRL